MIVLYDCAGNGALFLLPYLYAVRLLPIVLIVTYCFADDCAGMGALSMLPDPCAVRQPPMRTSVSPATTPTLTGAAPSFQPEVRIGSYCHLAEDCLKKKKGEKPCESFKIRAL